jgi:hypothetical protein
MPSRSLRLCHLTEHTSHWRRQNRMSSPPVGSDHNALPEIEVAHGSRKAKQISGVERTSVAIYAFHQPQSKLPVHLRLPAHGRAYFVQEYL